MPRFRQFISVLTAYVFLLQMLSLPASNAAEPSRNRCVGSQQDQAPAYPLASKDPAQQRCDQLAEAPGDPNNSGPGVRIDQINTSEAHNICYQAANGKAWRARYQFIFGRVLDAENNWADASKWYQAAGDNGYADGYANLGSLYIYSKPPNYQQAAAWFQKAAERYSAKGFLMLAWLYQTGQGVPRNPSEAVRLYSQAGDRLPEAAYRVGIMYEDGDGVAKDPYLAARWLYQAAQHGHAAAEEELGYLFYTGTGVPSNKRAAFDWFYPAAQAGFSRSQIAVALEYDLGEIVPKNPAEAVNWYRRAAEQGELYAMWQLGGHLRDGDGVAWSEAEAAQWFRKAADKGYALAQSSLGYGYLHGLGSAEGQGVQDYRQAAYWLTKAAQQGEPYAEMNLGWMYENGWGVERSLAQAKSLYLSAARSNNPKVAPFAKQFADSMDAYGSVETSSNSGSAPRAKTPDWVGPAIGITAVVGVLAFLFSGSSSGSRSSSSGGGYSGGSDFSSPNFDFGGSSSTPSTPTPHCRQVSVENAFSTPNGCELSTPGSCAGNSGATTIQCD